MKTGICDNGRQVSLSNGQIADIPAPRARIPFTRATPGPG